MKTSESINELAAALVALQGELQDAPKDKKNPHFGNSYSDLATVMKTLRPLLSKHGLALVQFPESEGNKVSVITRLLHKSGQWMDGTLTMQAKDASPQAIGSAVTYGRRYGAPAAVGMATEDDDDANAAQETQPRQHSRQRQERRQRQEEAPPDDGTYQGTEAQRNVLRVAFERHGLPTQVRHAVANSMKGKPMTVLEEAILVEKEKVNAK